MPEEVHHMTRKARTLNRSLAHRHRPEHTQGILQRLEPNTASDALAHGPSGLCSRRGAALGLSGGFIFGVLTRPHRRDQRNAIITELGPGHKGSNFGILTLLVCETSRLPKVRCCGAGHLKLQVVRAAEAWLKPTENLQTSPQTHQKTDRS